MSEAAHSVLERMRRAHPVRTVEAGGQHWSLQDVPGPGTLPPLLLLPGALGTGEVFFRVLDGLAGTRRLLALGFPPLPSAKALAASLAGLVDALALPRFDLLGTSLGGHVAQIFALQHPGRIRRLLLANTFHDPTLQQARWPAPEDYARQAPQDVLAAARRQLEQGAEPTPAHRELKELMLSLVGPHQDAGHVMAMRLAVLTATTLPELALPAGQVVLIDDSADPVIAAPTREALRLRHAGSRHFDIAGGGHFPANLQPEAYVAAIVAATAPDA